MSNPRCLWERNAGVLKSMRTIAEMKIGERTEIFDNVVVKGADKCIKINLIHQSSHPLEIMACLTFLMPRKRQRLGFAR
jgi:hypothetical protein